MSQSQEPRTLLRGDLETLVTWQFKKNNSATILVTYVCRMERKPTPEPENPIVELDLPSLVKITARPFQFVAHNYPV
jgi:hypothetical protein